MNTTLTLMDLAGAIALLIWGVHMVQTGITRAFGPQLRRILGYALGNRFKAFLAGLGVTAILQSSTATGLMTTAFAAGGLVDLVPALAVMLGANVGHHADRPGAVVRRVAGLVSVHPSRRVHVQAQRGYPHARPRPGGDRSRPDADRASAPAGDDHPLRGRAEPANAARCDHDRAADRCSDRCRVDLGGAFERRRRVVDHGLCGSGGHAAACRVCPRPRGQSRHRSEPAARKRGRRRPRRQAPADRQSDQPRRRLRLGARPAELDRPSADRARAQCRLAPWPIFIPASTSCWRCCFSLC